MEILAAHATPVFREPQGSATALQPLSADRYAEAALRDTLHASPTLLPLTQMDPRHAGSRLYSLCTEFPLRPEAAGSPESLDNLLITDEGHPILVECKLRRNSEARRKVVAQLLGYARAMHGMSVREFTDKVARRTGKRLNLPAHALLPDGAAPRPGRFEAQLAHALRHGDFDTVILTDEYHEEAEALATYLRRFPGLGARMHVVEARLFALGGGILFVPSLVATIDREVVGTIRVEHGAILNVEGPLPESAGPGTRNPLTRDGFDTALRDQRPTLPALWAEMRSGLEPLGVQAVLQRAEILRYVHDGHVHGIVEVHTDGAMRFGYAVWKQPPDMDPAVPLRFVSDMASLVGGEARTSGNATNIWIDDRVVRLSDFEGRVPEMIACVRRYIGAIQRAEADPVN